MKNHIFFLISLIFLFKFSIAQVNPLGLKLDETQLNLWAGTTIIDDQTAEGAKAIRRSSTAESATMWFGPYIKLQGGNYTIQFRMKVTSNILSDNLIQLDVVSFGEPDYLARIQVRPNMFRSSNEWQLFSIPVQIPDHATSLEIRGVSFLAGVTDLSLDYIQIIPGDFRGFYSPEFSVDGKGHILIGKSTQKDSHYMLDVAGSVRADEIIVNTTGADFVFADDYKLPSLSELEAFIKENRHLPEIPPASQMHVQGLKVGELNRLLLQKVEELTLYLIEKEHSDNIYKKELKLIKLQNQILRQKVNTLREKLSHKEPRSNSGRKHTNPK